MDKFVAMTMIGPDDTSTAHSAAQFATTHWSLVLAAKDSASPSAREALENLCRTYWYPLYAFACRMGRLPEDAQDLTQGFFVHLLESRLVASADATRGRFRSFLQKCFRNYMAAEYARATRQRRRYREVLNEVVLRTVNSPAELEHEVRQLLDAVQG